MKSTEYKAEKIQKNGITYTNFIFGNKCNKSRLITTILAMGGTLQKAGQRTTHYQLKGDWISLMVLQ